MKSYINYASKMGTILKEEAYSGKTLEELEVIAEKQAYKLTNPYTYSIIHEGSQYVYSADTNKLIDVYADKKRKGSTMKVANELLKIAKRLVSGETYNFFEDPGHGWLQVERSEIDALGIARKISPFSYQKGGYVYLEEDEDAGIFIDAMKAIGEPVQTRRVFEENTQIRNYRSFRA